MKIITVQPDVEITQGPRTSVVYELDPLVWDEPSDDWRPTVESFRPKGLGDTLKVFRARPKVGTFLRQGDRRTRVEAGKLGVCLAVSGGIAGATYTIQATPTQTFTVRVTTRE